MQKIVRQQQSLNRIDSLSSQQKGQSDQYGYLNPAKHRIFMKKYKLETYPPEIHTLAADMYDYYILVEAEMKKIIETIKSSLICSDLTHQISTLAEFIFQFNRRNIEIATKMIVKLNRHQQNISAKEVKPYCDCCFKLVEQKNIEKACEEMKLRQFNDPFNFYNVDRLNLRDMAAMRRQTLNIVDSELVTVQDRYDIRSECISYEQFQEVLNHLGSDIHTKDISIGQIINEMNSIDAKIMTGQLSENRQTQREQGEMKIFHNMSVEEGLRKRVVGMLQKFHTRLYDYRRRRMVDCETQVVLKENDIIRQLEVNVKELRKKMKQVERQRDKQFQQYESMIIKKDEAISQVKQSAQAAGQRMALLRIQDDKRILQLGGMVDVLRTKIHEEQVKSAYLSTMINNSKFEKLSANNKENNESLQKRMEDKRQNRKRSTMRPSNRSYKIENDQQQGEDTNSVGFKETVPRRQLKTLKMSDGGRKLTTADQKQKTRVTTSVKAFERNLSRYQKIDEANEEEENQEKERDRKKMNKMSRFKAIASLVISKNNESGKLKRSEQAFGQDEPQVLPLVGQDTRENCSQNNVGELIQQVQDRKRLQQQKQQESLLKQNLEAGDQNMAAKAQLLLRLYQTQVQNSYFSNFSYLMFVEFYHSFIESVFNIGGINAGKQCLPFSSSHSKGQYKKGNSKAKQQKLPKQEYKSLSVYQKDESKKQSRLNKKRPKQSGKFELLQKHNQFHMHKSKKPIKQQLNSPSTFPINPVQTTFGGIQLDSYKVSCAATPKDSESPALNVAVHQKDKNKVKIKIEDPGVFSQDQIIELFLGKENIFQYHSQLYKMQSTVFSLIQNQFLMSILAKLAQLHVQNKRRYTQIKNSLYFPQIILLSGDQIQFSEELSSKNQLRLCLRYFVILHRKCLEQQKGKRMVCVHLRSLLSKIDQYLDRQVKTTLQMEDGAEKDLHTMNTNKSNTAKILR